LLAAKSDHEMIEPYPVDFVEVMIAQPLQLYVLNFSSERRAAGDDRHE
jgi:hypothetical protein